MAASLELTQWILIKGCAVLAMCDVPGPTDLFFIYIYNRGIMSLPF